MPRRKRQCLACHRAFIARSVITKPAAAPTTTRLATTADLPTPFDNSEPLTTTTSRCIDVGDSSAADSSKQGTIRNEEDDYCVACRYVSSCRSSDVSVGMEYAPRHHGDNYMRSSSHRKRKYDQGSSRNLEGNEFTSPASSPDTMTTDDAQHEDDALTKCTTSNRNKSHQDKDDDSVLDEVCSSDSLLCSASLRSQNKTAEATTENKVADKPLCEDVTTFAAAANGDHDCESDNGSEAGDDMHRTQIVIEIDDESQNDDDDQPLRSLVHKEPFASRSITVCNASMSPPADHGMEIEQPVVCLDIPDSEDEDEPLIDVANLHDQNKDLKSCNVCGCSLSHIATGWKGRLNHIKRCAKKYQYTAKDVSFNDDHELFASPRRGGTSLDSTAAAVAASTATATLNPYTALNAWHGNEDAKTAAAQHTVSKAPSVFNALMAGARRVAKIAKIKAQSPPTATVKQRGGWEGGSKVDYSHRGCPAYKKISNTDFVVDGFHYAKPSLTKSYFLSHFHSDHYCGITKSWNTGIIYCSIGTANLVNQQLGVDRQYLHPLPMNTTTVIESEGKPVVVTLIDANHCPGAVMFLFQVGKRNVLHVGDFRWSREAMQAQAPLRPFMNGTHRIDDIYLDTTYCDPKYDLPSQHKAIEAAIEVALKEVDTATRTKKKLLMLFGAYTIGTCETMLRVLARYTENNPLHGSNPFTCQVKRESIFRWPRGSA
jgi:Cft2 family RNA processing exonuclease